MVMLPSAITLCCLRNNNSNYYHYNNNNSYNPIYYVGADCQFPKLVK